MQFHSPGCRRRCTEFLKMDFPRLPLTGKLELFRALARRSGELTARRLQESPVFESVGDDVRSLKSNPGQESQ